MSSACGLRSFQFTEYRHLWLFAVGISALIHFQSFWIPHIEGDEEVYLALSREIHWDLSHYTTRDDLEIREFPDSIYRSNLFHHPPLLPLVMKLGGTLFGTPVAAGLLFQNFAMWVLLYYTCALDGVSANADRLGAIAFAAVTFCPLLLSSSMLLHHDVRWVVSWPAVSWRTWKHCSDQPFAARSSPACC